MSLARFSVRNPVPVNLLMIAIIIMGTVSLISLPRELMSNISFNWVFISKVYPGVTAEEIEKLITIPIEDEIRDVLGIDSITSQSVEGVAFISVKFKQMSDEDFRARLDDLRAEIDKVKDLPKDAEKTEIMNFGSADMVPLISVHLYGHAAEKKMVELAKQLREELLVVPQVAKVQLMGVREREIWVEADPDKLRGYALSPEILQLAISSQGLNIPAGRLPVGRKELLVRTVGRFETPDEISQVIIRSTPDGQSVRVGDIASIRDTFEEDRTRASLNREPVISLTITKQNQGSSIAITDEVKRIAHEFGEHHKNFIKIGVTQDSSEQINDMLAKLSANAWLGFVVVALVLFIVMGFRNAILAALGIPLSFLTCFIFMHYNGESFNGNSLFGLVLVLGIIVDDAIVIVENCYRHLQMGKSWHDAAIDGTSEVMGPVASATATTIAAFLPLILLPGIMGKFLRIVPLTVSLALLASLLEAFLILPSHFADWPGRTMVRRTEKPWMIGLQESYERALRFVIRRRRSFVLGMVLVVPCAGLLIPLVGIDMFSGEEINMFQVRVTMPTGTNLDVTAATLREFEKSVQSLPADEVRNVHATAGLVMTDTDWVFRTDIGQLWVDIPMSYARKRSADEIMNDLRGSLNAIAGPLSIEFAKVNTGPPVGKPVEIKLKGKYLDQLKEVSKEMTTHLAALPGVKDVGDDLREGKQEIRITVDHHKAALYGLSVAEVGMVIRTALDGVKAGSLFDGDEEIDIMVKLNKKVFQRPEDLLRLPLTLKQGVTISLGEVASFTLQASYAEIRRYRNQRAITIFAGAIDETKNSGVKVNQAMEQKFEQISAKYPGISLDFSGEFQEFKESFKSLAKLFLFGLILIYVILGAQFRSYLQPVVILCTVPFAFVGAMMGLVISGNQFSLITLFGMVALAGVAVNDAIVLISFANTSIAQGMDPIEAMVQAGRLRLRPIILTSVTTICGLLPMAMGLGGMSLTWGPLANTIVWGLGVGTLLTLFIIPAVYLTMVHDIKSWLFKRDRRASAP